MGDFKIAGHDFFLAKGPNGELTNSWIEEDASPTALQSAEGAPDAASVPVARTEYTSFGGNLGLFERSLQPGDFTRWYMADWDASHPGQVTSWVRWPGDQVALSGGPGVTIPTLATPAVQCPFALVEDANAPGFVCSVAAGGAAFYQWDGTTFTYQRAITNRPVGNFFAGVIGGGYFVPPPTVAWPVDGGVWMLDQGGGTTNLLTDTHDPTAPGDALIPFFDFVAVLALDVSFNIEASAYRPVWTPVQTQQFASGVHTNTASGTGVSTVNAVGTIRSAKAIMGAVASQGIIWLVTNNTCYAVQWNDSFNTWLMNQLFRVSRFTGAPTDWNAEVYIPFGNRLAHIIPGQKGFDTIPLDQFGMMRPPFNGRIVQCIPTADALFCKVVEESPTAARAAVMRLDAQGSWSCVVCDQSAASTLARLPLVRTADTTTNPPAVGYFTDATHVRLLPTQDSGRNPVTMVVSQRPQAATVRGVSPWETGQSPTSQKQILRYRLHVEDIVGEHVRVSYQLPADAVTGATDTYSDGAAAGTGTWHPCGDWTAGAAGSSGSIDANGNGWIWCEFDGATSYPNGVGVLPLYPDYTEVRWLLELNGDTTGTHVPRIRSFTTDREEYLSKVKVITAFIDLSTNIRDRGEFDDDYGATDAVRDEGWVRGELAFLEGLMSGKRAQTLVSPKKDANGNHLTYQVEITKWTETLDGMNDAGPQGGHVRLSMKVIPQLGVL